MTDRIKNHKKAQSFVEYSIVIAIILAALTAMNPFIKRGIQGMIKTAADEIGVQTESEQEQSDETGYFNSAYVSTRTSQERYINQFVGPSDYTTTLYNYTEASTTVSRTNAVLGFTEETPP